MSDTTPAPTPGPQPEDTTPTREAPTPTGSGRFAVYDTTLLRYVGGVVDKRPSKSDANKLVHTRDAFRIDEV